METISMSRKERARLEVFSRVREGNWTVRQAAGALGVSYRQAKRIWARYQQEGDGGLVHRLRGRKSNRQPAGKLKRRALRLYQEKYADYGPTLASECLLEEDGLQVVPETLRRWLKAAELWKPARIRKVHRRRRARKEHYGELVQMDGSHHDWFEGRRGWAVLMVVIDDATGVIDARFFEEETLSAAFEMLGRYARRNGLPSALYVDRSSIYRSDREPTGEEILAGKQPQTQFGRAMEELGVRLILARSPQAKGRVERCNGTLQDRLVKALRRAKISDLKTANAFLEREFLKAFNARFSKEPQRPEDLHQRLSRRLDLNLILSVREDRVVQNDWTVRWQNRFLQLSRRVIGVVQPKGRVSVHEQLDGRLRLFAGKLELEWSSIRTEFPPSRPRRVRGKPTGSSQDYKPAPTHPWRRGLPGGVASPDSTGLLRSASARLRSPPRSGAIRKSPTP